MLEISFSDDKQRTLHRITTKYDNISICCDLNFDMLNDDKKVHLENVCDVFDLSNIVKKATCFRSGSVPSLLDLDVFLSTCPPKNHANTDSSYVSDFKKICMVSFILMS